MTTPAPTLPVVEDDLAHQQNRIADAIRTYRRGPSSDHVSTFGVRQLDKLRAGVAPVAVSGELSPSLEIMLAVFDVVASDPVIFAAIANVAQMRARGGR